MQTGIKYKCAFFRDGKLSLLLGEGILVMRAWPPMAWCRENPGAPWLHARPRVFDLNMGEPRRRIRRALRHMTSSQRQLCAQRAGAIRDQPPDKTPCSQGDPSEPTGSIVVPAPPAFLSVFEGLEADLRAFEAFYAGIPGDVANAVSPFPWRHFGLVSFCARCPGGLDLLRSTPALALMLANCGAFGRAVRRPLRSCRWLLRETQRRQLEWLEFPDPGKSTVRVLRKVPARWCSVGLLVWLREALRDPAARKHLEHLPVINRGVVLFVSSPGLLRHVTHGFLEEVGQCEEEGTKARAGYDMARMLEQLGGTNRVRGLRFNSLRQFREFREAVDQRYAHRLHGEDDPFPEPPVPGNDWIIPLATPLDLEEEARVMHHCIESFARHIVNGTAYAYSVLLPGERATLILAREGASRSWHIIGCRGVCNTMAGAATLQRIQMWIEAKTPGRKPGKSRDIPGQMLLPGVC